MLQTFTKQHLATMQDHTMAADEAVASALRRLVQMTTQDNVPPAELQAEADRAVQLMKTGTKDQSDNALNAAAALWVSASTADLWSPTAVM